MTQNSRGKTATQLSMPKKLPLPERATSPQIPKSCPQKQATKKMQTKVPVIYYLSRNGQLEHPHFLEVPLSSPQGLLLRDVTKRLDSLRGQGMSNMYSWSAKRSYKTGYVWVDLLEDDILQPAHGNEYVLKGSRLLESCESFRSYETALSSSYSSSTSKNSSSESCTCSEEDSSKFLANPRRMTKSKSSRMPCDDHKVYKVKTDGEFLKKAANAATQTDNNKGKCERVEIEEVEDIALPLSTNTELFNEIGDVDGSADIRDQRAGNDRPSGRMKASLVLMQLISCGSKKGPRIL